MPHPDCSKIILETGAQISAVLPWKDYEQNYVKPNTSLLRWASAFWEYEI